MFSWFFKKAAESVAEAVVPELAPEMHVAASRIQKFYRFNKRRRNLQKKEQNLRIVEDYFSLSRINTIRQIPLVGEQFRLRREENAASRIQRFFRLKKASPTYLARQERRRGAASRIQRHFFKSKRTTNAIIRNPSIIFHPHRGGLLLQHGFDNYGFRGVLRSESGLISDSVDFRYPSLIQNQFQITLPDNVLVPNSRHYIPELRNPTHGLHDWETIREENRLLYHDLDRHPLLLPGRHGYLSKSVDILLPRAQYPYFRAPAIVSRVTAEEPFLQRLFTLEDFEERQRVRTRAMYELPRTLSKMIEHDRYNPFMGPHVELDPRDAQLIDIFNYMSGNMKRDNLMDIQELLGYHEPRFQF